MSTQRVYYPRVRHGRGRFFSIKSGSFEAPGHVKVRQGISYYHDKNFSSLISGSLSDYKPVEVSIDYVFNSFQLSVCADESESDVKYSLCTTSHTSEPDVASMVPTLIHEL